MKSNSYTIETAGELMTTKIPTAKKNETVAHILKRLATPQWDDVHTVYIVTEERKLEGRIPLTKILSSPPYTILGRLMEEVKITVTPHTDQERIVVETVKNDVKSLPVVDHDHIFIGAITSDKIIDVLHEEHLEDFLRSAGIHGKGRRIINLIDESIVQVVVARLPWLIVGLLIGLFGSIITSKFQLSLREHIALVFFIPIITYMSDAVGTQTESIFIRTETVTKIQLHGYLIRETIVGFLMGIVLGITTSIFGYFLSGSMVIGIVVGISLFTSITFATVLAIITPSILKFLGKDPALGSGPFTTSLQDVISLFIYFSIAKLFLG